MLPQNNTSCKGKAATSWKPVFCFVSVLKLEPWEFRCLLGIGLGHSWEHLLIRCSLFVVWISKSARAFCTLRSSAFPSIYHNTSNHNLKRANLGAVCISKELWSIQLQARRDSVPWSLVLPRFIIHALLYTWDKRDTIYSLVAAPVFRASNSAKHLSVCLASRLPHQAHAYVPLT